MVKTSTIISVAVAVSCLVWSQRLAGVEPVRDHDLVPEDYFTIGTITGVAASPNGEYVAYTESRWEPPEEKRNTDLWVVEVATKEMRRLTFDRAGDTSPKWSPDSRFIYFKSGRKRAGEEEPPYDGKGQVWRVSVDGGEPRAVTRVKDGVGLYDLSGDGKTLYYTTSEEHIEDEWKDIKKEYSKLEYGHGVTKISQVWKLDLVNWRAKKIVDEKRVIMDMDVSSDQRRIAMVTKPDSTQLTAEGWSRVDVYDAATEKVSVVSVEGWRKDHDSPYGWIDSVDMAPDGEVVAWTVSFDGYPTRVYVAEWAGEASNLRELERPNGVTVTGGTIQWRSGSRDLCFIGEDHARARVYAITSVFEGRQGRARTMLEGDVVVHGFSFPDGGAPMLVSMSRPTHDRDLFSVTSGDTYERLTNVNPQMAAWKMPQISLFEWQGAHGDTVQGILELPPDYKEGDGPVPLVVEVHGGPTAATLYQFRFWIYGRALMPAKGYAVLSPNYRGSTGYGDKFMVELIGHENDIDVQDILAGVDAVIERGIADPDRLAVMGWSNGGFLTNCLITHTDRFKAASSGAGVVDQVIQWGTEDTPGHVINYMEHLPWSDPDAFRAGSPLYHLDKVKTPTLIHVGENDERVPAVHARTLHRALYRYLHVPTELVVYPGEGHGLTTYTHRKAKMEWDLAWFGKYLNPPTKEPKVPVPADGAS